MCVHESVCLQQRKTSLLLAYIEILQHFSLQILVLYLEFVIVFCFALSSALPHLSLLTRAFASPTSYIIRWNATLSWTHIQQLAEARDYSLEF